MPLSLRVLYSYAAVDDNAEDSEGAKDPEFVARQEIIARFDGLSRQLPIQLHHSVLISRSIDVVARAVVYARSARSGKLHFSPLSSAGFTGRPHLYVVGLDNQKSAGNLAEDPLFSDREKDAAIEETSVRLIPMARHQASTLRDQLSRAVSRFDGHVKLIYSTYDVGNNRETGASAALMSVSGISEEKKKSIKTGSFAPEQGAGIHEVILDHTDMLMAVVASTGKSVSETVQRLALCKQPKNCWRKLCIRISVDGFRPKR